MTFWLARSNWSSFYFKNERVIYYTQNHFSFGGELNYSSQQLRLVIIKNAQRERRSPAGFLCKQTTGIDMQMHSQWQRCFFFPQFSLKEYHLTLKVIDSVHHRN